MASIGVYRSRFALSCLLACLFCLGTNAFIISTTNVGISLWKQPTAASGPKISPIPITQQHQPFGAIHATIANDDTPINNKESSKLTPATMMWKNPWKLFLRISLALKKRPLFQKLQKRTVALSLILSIMTFRIGVLPVHASTAATLEEPAAVVVTPNEDLLASATTLEEPAAVVVTPNEDPEDVELEQKSSNIAKAGATVALAASGANFFRLNRKQQRMNQEAMEEFESWNASWNATDVNQEEKVKVRVNGRSSYPNAEMDLLSNTNATWNVVEMIDCCAGNTMERDDVMKATVEAMKQAGGESTELVQEQMEEEEEPIDELEIQQDISNVLAEVEPSIEEDPSIDRTEYRKKYPKERMPILDPAERVKVQAKYASIDSLEDRAFQILLDLGMIEKHE